MHNTCNEKGYDISRVAFLGVSAVQFHSNRGPKGPRAQMELSDRHAQQRDTGHVFQYYIKFHLIGEKSKNKCMSYYNFSMWFSDVMVKLICKITQSHLTEEN